MTKDELIKAIHDLVHGKGIIYQVVDEDIDGDKDLTIFFQRVGEDDD